MFALLSAIVFFLALVHVSLGSVSLLFLGLFLLALHSCFEVALPFGRRV